MSDKSEKQVSNQYRFLNTDGNIINAVQTTLGPCDPFGFARHTPIAQQQLIQVPFFAPEMPNVDLTSSQYVKIQYLTPGNQLVWGIFTPCQPQDAKQGQTTTTLISFVLREGPYPVQPGSYVLSTVHPGRPPPVFGSPGPQSGILQTAPCHMPLTVRKLALQNHPATVGPSLHAEGIHYGNVMNQCGFTDASMYGELPVGEIVPSTQVGNSGMPSQGSSISTGRNLESGSITELKSSKVAGFSRSKEARGESVLPVKWERKEEVQHLDDGNGWKLKIRQYQLDLYKAASRRNVIAYLDTGSGKTFISVLLIRDVHAKCSKTEKPKGSIFFLVPRKVLVKQQADVIKKFTDLEVSEHSGDRSNEDVWDKSTWQLYLGKADVLVMTPQILLNLLRKEVVRVSHLNLIVFDECHHTRKNNPYNGIMQEFYHPAKQNGSRVPKIFGMTASLVTKKRSSEEVWNSFLELENNLDSMIVTSTREGVRSYATSASELDVLYSMNTKNEHLPGVFNRLERATVRLNLANKLSLIHNQRHLHNSSWKADNKKQRGPLEQHIRQIGNIQHVIAVMGLLAGSFAVTEIVQNWMDRSKDERKLSTWNFPHSLVEKTPLSTLDERYLDYKELQDECLNELSTVLQLSLMDVAIAISAGMLCEDDETASEMLHAAANGRINTMKDIFKAISKLRDRLDLSAIDSLVLEPSSQENFLMAPVPRTSSLLSHRMEQLFRLLVFVKTRIPVNAREGWRGMIFVQQTLMAIVLEHVISLNHHLKFFNCQSLTGHNGAIMSASMEDHHQRKIVDYFRKGKINLLICTSVAEEGLDITQCSTVIRFDLPFTEASYIQSRGRARKPGSLYAMFVNQDDAEETTRIQNLRFAEQCMKEFAAFRQNQDDRDEDEDLFSGTKDADTEIEANASSAVVMHSQAGNETGMNVAVEMVYKYVNQLPQDEYSQLKPDLIYRIRDIEGRQEYQYQLTLPNNAAVTDPILGEWCQSKQKAKKNVCFAACMKLRDLGELNNNFYPIDHKTCRDMQRGRNRMKTVPYSADTPINPEILKPVHRDVSDSSGRTGLYLQVAKISPTPDQGTSSWKNQGLDCGVVVEHFGILTLKHVDCLSHFPLYPETGETQVEFEDRDVFEVSADELAQLKKYHMAVVEALYFRSKLFQTICRDQKNPLSLMNSDIDLVPEELKDLMEKIPNVNESWYLLCPVQISESPDRSKRKVPGSSSTNRSSNRQGASIDWETVRSISTRVDRIQTQGINMTEESLNYGDILVSAYNPNAYKLVGVRDDLDLNSDFPTRPKKDFYRTSVTKEYKGSFVPNRSGAEYSTFLDYYTKHWKFEDVNAHQPLLECVPFKELSVMKQAKNLLNPLWKQSGEVETAEDPVDDWNLAIHLVPQLVSLYPINYQFWKSLSFIVAICWKMESMVKMDELRRYIFGDVSPSVAVPDIAMLYESVTSRSCHEHCTYERLEFIGDAALKYISSLYCFFKYPTAHEGILTTNRIGIISNKQLARTAVTHNLQKYVRTVQIGDHPWRPAGSHFLDVCWLSMGKNLNDGAKWFGGRNQKVSQQNQNHQSGVCNLSIKQVADVVEALIGACYLHGGIPCVCALIDRMGILDGSASFLLITQNQGEDHKAWLKGIADCQGVELKGLQEFSEVRSRVFEPARDIRSVEKSIHYLFSAPSFALEALTHCSWPHHDPPCYQRLEYLGDAVLDFMITIHYFNEYPDLDPGQLTALRSASVNNDELVAKAVVLGLYKNLLYCSSYLASHISDYVDGFSYEDGDKGAPKVLGDIVESLIGAVYLDINGDLEKTWDIWKPILHPFYTPENVPVHPIVQLTNHCQTLGVSFKFVEITDASLSLTDQIEFYDDSSESTDSDSDSEDDLEGAVPRRLCGKQGLMQMEESSRPTKKYYQVIVNDKVVGQGGGSHVKGAKRQAALVAMKSLPWDL